MRAPTKGELFAQLIEHLRKAQEACANLSHLTADERKSTSRGWLAVSEGLKKTQHIVTQIAMEKMH